MLALTSHRSKSVFDASNKMSLRVGDAHLVRGFYSLSARVARLEFIQGRSKMADGALNMGELL